MNSLILAGFFTLSAKDAEVRLTPKETCIAGDCVATGDAKVADDGTWVFDSGIRVKWSSNTEGTLSLDGRTWVDAELAFTTPSETPPTGIEVLGQHHPGVAPGRWTRETADCDRKQTVWVFTPIVKEQPTLGAYARDDGWAIRTGVRVVMCSDSQGQFGGVP
jgi:hypothetical protein